MQVTNAIGVLHLSYYATFIKSRGERYSHILAIRVFAAGEGMVFKPFGLV